MPQMKIGIVDNENDWLKIISRILNEPDDILISWTASNETEALKLINSINVDIILLDLNLTKNNFDGLNLAETIISKNKDIKIVIVTSFNIEELVTKSFLNGAIYYLLKENIEDLPNILRNINTKNNPYEILIREYQKAKKELLIQDLTISEKEIYKLRTDEGLSITQIAFRTKKSAGTIRNQLSSAYQKIRRQN